MATYIALQTAMPWLDICHCVVRISTPGHLDHILQEVLPRLTADYIEILKSDNCILFLQGALPELFLITHELNESILIRLVPLEVHSGTVHDLWL